MTSETSRDWVSVLAGNSPRFWREFSPGKFTKNVARFVCYFYFQLCFLMFFKKISGVNIIFLFVGFSIKKTILTSVKTSPVFS